jgi:hypothetical protein
VVRTAERMKEMVQVNSAGSTRLASSAQELASQAEALQETVGRFQVDPARPVAFVPRRAAGAAAAGAGKA